MGQENKHILVITSWYPTKTDQSGIFVKEQCEALAKMGYKMCVMHFHYYSLLNYIKNVFSKKQKYNWKKSKLIDNRDYFCVSLLPTKLFLNSLNRQKKVIKNWINFYLRLYTFLNGKPNIIHHHGTLNYTYITTQISNSFNIPYIFTEHSSAIKKGKVPLFHSYESNSSINQFVKNAKTRIAVNNKFKKKCERVFDAEFVTLPNMVSSAFATNDVIFSKSVEPKFEFLNVAHFTPNKRQIHLIEAFNKAFGSNEKVTLSIVGSGNPRMTRLIKEEIEKYNLKDRVKLLGNLKRADLTTAMKHAHSLVISSKAESFGMVAIEGMAMGLPVVSTICGGPEDFIGKEQGVLCKVDDVEDLEEKMKFVYNNFDKYDLKKISEYAKNNFSEKKIMKELTGILHRSTTT